MDDIKIQVSLTKGNNDGAVNALSSFYDLDKDFKNLDLEVKIQVLCSCIKVDLAKIIQPIVAGTPMNSYAFSDLVVDNLDINKSNITKLFNRNIVKTLILNEIYRVAIQATSITGKDYAEHINKNDGVILGIADKIVSCS